RTRLQRPARSDRPLDTTRELLERESELEVDQRCRVLEPVPMLFVEQRHAAISAEDLVDGVAIEKTAVENRNTSVLGRRDHAVDAGHAAHVRNLVQNSPR